MPHSTTPKAESLNTLIANRLFEFPYQDCRNQRFVDVYLHTESGKFSFGFSGYMHVDSKNITNRLAHLVQSLRIVIFNRQLI